MRNSSIHTLASVAFYYMLIKGRSHAHATAIPQTSSSSKSTSKNTFGCHTDKKEPFILDDTQKTCNLFAEYTANPDLASILALTGLAQECPGQSTTVNLPTNNGGVIAEKQSVLVCGSHAHGLGLQAYELYCLEEINGVESVVSGDYFRQAFAKYLATVEANAPLSSDNNNNQNSSPHQEIVKRTMDAYQLLLPSECLGPHCLRGCAQFVASHCCGETAALEPAPLPSCDYLHVALNQVEILAPETTTYIQQYTFSLDAASFPECASGVRIEHVTFTSSGPTVLQESKRHPSNYQDLVGIFFSPANSIVTLVNAAVSLANNIDNSHPNAIYTGTLTIELALFNKEGAVTGICTFARTDVIADIRP